MTKSVKTATTSFDVSALKRTIGEINKTKEKASEYNGQAGAATKTACETYNFNKKALTFVAGLARKEPAQQLEIMGAIVTYAKEMGMFDQMDMFNDCVAAMQAVVEAAVSDRPGNTASGAVNIATLAAGAAPPPH